MGALAVALVIGRDRCPTGKSPNCGFANLGFITHGLSALLTLVMCRSSHSPNTSSRPWIDSRSTIQSQGDACPASLCPCIARHYIAALSFPAYHDV